VKKETDLPEVSPRVESPRETFPFRSRFVRDLYVQRA